MAKTKIDLKTLSIDEMLDLRDAIDTRLSEIATTELSEMQRRMDRLSKIAKPARAATAKAVKTEKKPTRSKRKATRKPHRLKGTKAPAKFRDPKTGATWSGRGMTPVWLRTHEANGKKRSDFAV